MAKYGIINRKNQFYEFEAEDVFTAVDMYIDSILGYEIKFSMSSDLWNNSIKETMADVYTRITLINGLCTSNQYDIVKIISDYNDVYVLTS